MASRILGEEQETGVPLRSVNSGLVCPYSPSPKPRAIVISVTTMTTARAHRNRLIAAVSIVRYRTINVTSLLEQPSGTYSNLVQSGSMTSIDTVDRSELLQQVKVTGIETDDPGELRPITGLVLNYVTPDFHASEQERPPYEWVTVLFPGANDILERIDTVLPYISRSRSVGQPNVVLYEHAM